MAPDKKIDLTVSRAVLSRRSPHNLLLILFILIGLCGATSCVTENEPKNTGIMTGDPLPDFSVTLNDGRIISGNTLKGKPAVFEFFNTSCGDCRRSLPVIDRLYKEWEEDSEVLIFAIAREEEQEEIEAYWKANDFSLPYSPQSGRKIYDLFASTGIPRIFVTDREGVVIAAFGPEDNPTLSDLNHLITSHKQP